MRKYLCLWRDLLVLCWRVDRARTASLLLLELLGAVAIAGLGLMLRTLVDGSGAGARAAVVLGALGAALAFVTHWGIGHIAYLTTIHLVERVALTEVEPHVLTLCAALPQIEHLERPDFLDRVTALRGQAGGVVDSAWAVLQMVSSTMGLIATLAVLGSVDARLLLLLPCAGIQLWVEGRGGTMVANADLASAADLRLHRHLYNDVCTNPKALKEIRSSGAGPAVLRLQEEVWARVAARRFRASLFAALLSSAGWLVFAGGFATAVALVAQSGTAGEVVLAVTVGTQVRGVVAGALDRSARAGGYRRLLRPYLWLHDYAASNGERPGAAPPARLQVGIKLSDVTFAYSGSGRPAVQSVSAFLPAGSVVALVGEYGSGKTTLAKLLAKLYHPTTGRVEVDGIDLRTLDTAQWRARLSAVFQDFGRYHATLAESVMLGDTRRDLAAAIEAADAGDLVARLPDGTETLLGKRFGGVEMSEGQWQKLALARGCLRAEPLLFVLDEPTASLDAPSEHAVFTGYIRRARTLAATTGAITMIVSHRFSTVADADLILVMEKGRLVEIGTHERLLDLNGTYAELFNLQASGHAAA